MPPKVTACLITWKRPGNIYKIKQNLAQQSFIDEILVRDHEEVANIKNYGRYVLAKEARNDIIYLQDDDLLIENVGVLYETFLKNPDSLINGGPKEYLEVAKTENIYGNSQMAIVGWGSMLDRKHIPLLDQYTDVYGEDYCFHRETDRILSMLMKQHHKMVETRFETLEGARSEYALSKQSDHIRYKKLAIKRCLELQVNASIPL